MYVILLPYLHTVDMVLIWKNKLLSQNHKDTTLKWCHKHA